MKKTRKILAHTHKRKLSKKVEEVKVGSWKKPNLRQLKEETLKKLLRTIEIVDQGGGKLVPSAGERTFNIISTVIDQVEKKTRNETIKQVVESVPEVDYFIFDARKPRLEKRNPIREWKKKWLEEEI